MEGLAGGGADVLGDAAFDGLRAPGGYTVAGSFRGAAGGADFVSVTAPEAAIGGNAAARELLQCRVSAPWPPGPVAVDPQSSKRAEGSGWVDLTLAAGQTVVLYPASRPPGDFAVRPVPAAPASAHFWGYR